jgi:23S rRNA (adenine2503-C2)-methyltransferase
MSSAEIVAQVLLGRSGEGSKNRLRGVVLMGIGEPLHNYDAVARALTLLGHPEGMGLSLRRFTLSTCGLVPGIDRLARDFGGRVRLAVSIHAADDETRASIMPVTRKYPLRDLMEALRDYPVPPNGTVTIEYTLIRGINDSPQHARRLSALLRGVPATVNLIPMNRVPGTELDAPDEATVDVFQRTLRRFEVRAFVRRRRGGDVAAACGQLALRDDIRRALDRRPGTVQ